MLTQAAPMASFYSNNLCQTNRHSLLPDIFISPKSYVQVIDDAGYIL